MMFMGGWMVIAGLLLLAVVVALAAGLGAVVAVLLARTARR